MVHLKTTYLTGTLTTYAKHLQARPDLVPEVERLCGELAAMCSIDATLSIVLRDGAIDGTWGDKFIS